jgi:hypothetical protein
MLTAHYTLSQMNFEWVKLVVRRFFKFIFHKISKKFISGATAIGTATIAFWMRDDLTPWNLEATFTISYNTVSDSKFIDETYSDQFFMGIRYLPYYAKDL